MSRQCQQCALWGLITCAFLTGAHWLSAGEFQSVRDVTYVQRGDEEIKADVYVPDGSGPFPGVLVVHGDADRLVPITSPKAMIRAMTAAGVETRLYVVEGAGHMQAFNDLSAQAEAVRFFADHLKK